MAEDHRAGAVYWIDHYVVPTNDLERSRAFYANVLGTQARNPGGQDMDAGPGAERELDGLFLYVAGRAHLGSFVQDAPLPASQGPAGGLPRYGYYIRPEEVEQHLRRLDRYAVPHTDPVRTSEEGQTGLAIYFQDPDGNQLELWAPEHLPEGAMEGEGALHVGRISSAVFESRDLSHTLDFYTAFCGIDPIATADIPKDTVAFALEGGGRLVFKQVDTLGTRTGGHTRWRGLHTALVVRDDEFLPSYHRMWDALPEWDYDPAVPYVPAVDDEQLPARTGLHGNPTGPQWKATFGRGDAFYDWDTNAYHFVAGVPVGGSMATFTSRGSRHYLQMGQRGSAPA